MSATIQIEELKTLILNVYRFDPSKDNKAYMQDIEIEIPALVCNICQYFAVYVKF